MPGWLRGHSVLWLGGVLALVVVLLAAGFLLYEKRALEAAEIRNAELYARLLQDHAERTFNTVDITLNAVADGLDDVSTPAAQLSQDLARAQGGLPFLRSISLMDAEGVILASSVAANIGVRVDLRRLVLPPAGALESLGTSVAGRDLADIADGIAAGSPTGERTFVPLVRRLTPTRPRFLVAALNPEFFANEHELVLADATLAAALFSIDKTLLSGTRNIRMNPGEGAGAHRFFSQYLPERESGSFIGPGIDGDRVVTAFRVLRHMPLAVVVERPFDAVLNQFLQTVVWTLSGAFAALVVIAGMGAMAWRSLHAHERVQGVLNATRQEVARSERDLRGLVESVHELIFRADAQGRIVFVNGRWQQLTGHPDSSVLGRRFADICLDEDRARCDAMFAPGRADGDSIRVKVPGAGNRMLVLDLSVSTVTRAAEGTLEFAGFAVDITERHLARQALESQLQFTAQLLELSPTPVFVTDEHGRLTTVNRAWLEMMGLTLPEALGREPHELPGLGAALSRDRHAMLLHSEARASLELRLCVAGREPRDTVVNQVRFTRADGTPAGTVGSIVDVTEFREAERKIRKARDAAAVANGAKSEFIANISHELRTPLQGIIGFSEMGIELAASAGELREMFSDIHAGGQRMLTLVNALLDVSQIEGAPGSLELERCDVAPLVRDTLLQVQAHADSRQQVLVLQGLDVPVLADVDPARFQQALLNVVSNAVRFAPQGSEIEVACASRQAGGIEISVRDHGPGIPEDELEAVFESFVQSSRTRDGSGGTGLGLTITRKIVGAHGGRVVAANAPGGGAVIRIQLPPLAGVGSTNPPPAQHSTLPALLAPEEA